MQVINTVNCGKAAPCKLNYEIGKAVRAKTKSPLKQEVILDIKKAKIY